MRYEARPGVVYMEASCHHRKRGQMGACGGCYARAVATLQEIAKRPIDAGQIVKRALEAMRAEAPRKKEGKR